VREKLLVNLGRRRYSELKKKQSERDAMLRAMKGEAGGKKGAQENRRRSDPGTCIQIQETVSAKSQAKRYGKSWERGGVGRV